ncbi:MAG: NAD(P)H-hydrate dehydratase, partial [Candidatus Altiarchaeota archaeon]|nr:NAD(P)H-hydrate dehydratase [Candidatus Altiarchaeota archaeon]
IGKTYVSLMDSRAVDVNSAFFGVSVSKLMENAGAAVAKHCRDYDRIAVFCGCGNNGGDGLVAARHLIKQGKHVTCFVLNGRRSKLNLTNLKKLGSGNIRMINSCTDFDLEGYELVVDAIFGVGFRGELRQPIYGVIDKINGSDAKKISVDTPSAGKVEADVVISLDTAKVLGAVVEDIGIPPEAKIYCGPGDVQVAIPKRTGAEHKGDFGRLIVLGGSREYIGTPTLVAQAALRAGVDLVTLCVPQYVADKMPFDPNLIVHPLKSRDKITSEDVKEVFDMSCDAIVFGNGIGKNTKDAVEYFMQKLKVPAVVDADALSQAEKSWLNHNMILTPHQGEYKKLLKTGDVAANAKKTGSVIILKGETDEISDGVETRLNKTGNPYMTVGGTGDVLAGTIGALVAQNGDRMLSATAGTFLTGFAGDLAAEKFGVSLTATDVIAELPSAIRQCLEFDAT